MIKKTAIIFCLAIMLILVPQMAGAKVPVELQWDVTYTHSSNNQLLLNGYTVYNVITVGEIEVTKVKRDIIMPSLIVRCGSPEKNIEFIIPYSYRRDYVLDRDNINGDEYEESTVDGMGLGDIRINLNAAAPIKNTTVTLGVKTTTGVSDVGDDEIPLGSGHLGIRAGVSHMMPLDPVVLFGSANYYWNLENDAVDPGDTIQYSLGMAYALNPRFSINARLEQAVTTQTREDGVRQPETGVNSAMFYVGGSFADGGSTSSYDLSVGIGMTEDAPDMSIQFSRPIEIKRQN